MKGILSKTAEEQGYYKWDGVTLSDYIKEKYDIDLESVHIKRASKIIAIVITEIKIESSLS